MGGYIVCHSPKRLVVVVVVVLESQQQLV